MEVEVVSKALWLLVEEGRWREDGRVYMDGRQTLMALVEER
jgi:hypothetical protein